MQFFILFIVGAVIIGAGSMLSPAWPTKQPRVGLAATFSLALIVGGAVWWAEMFGWSTLVIDYLLFALVSVVILGGTMAQAQERAEARGEELLDEEMGWPGPEDLAFFALVAILASIPLFILNLPLGDEAAANAMVTLAAREGGTFTSLAPFYPEITGFAPPGFHALTAYLSQQLRQPIPMIHMAVGSVVAFLCVWMAYDLGAEIRDKRLGRAMALAMIGSLGIAYLLLYSYYSQLMGILFALAFMTYALRYYRHHLLVDMIAAGLMLGAILYVAPTLFLIALIAYYLWLIVLHIPIRRQPSKTVSQWTPLSRIGLWLGVLAVCAFGVMPWIWNNWEQLSQLEMTWQDILWNSSVYTIMVTVIAGFILLAIFDRLPRGLQSFLRGTAYLQMVIGLIFIGGLAFWGSFWYSDSHNYYDSQSDLAAMNWLIENTPQETHILNHPSARWVLPVTGRKAVYLPYLSLIDLPDLSFSGDIQGVKDKGYRFNVFWEKAIEAMPILLEEEIEYLIVPEWISTIYQYPSRYGHFYWFDEEGFEQLDQYFELVFEQEGAKVYRVLTAE